MTTPMTGQSNGHSTQSGGQLGTFGGVFTPSILTILGLVLFLRLGYVVGNVGYGGALLILGMATSVAVLTSISLAAIATNMKVRGGGVYFIISRTLGPAFGGAIGLVLYCAMSISIAFYTIGFGEALSSILGIDAGRWAQPIAAITVFALLGLAWLGADIATRLQYVVMVLLVLALVSYFLGVTPDLDGGVISENLGTPSDSAGFWVVFAIFFPAITGFTQGVAMSGDLRTPSRSITTGTFAAVGLSTIIYFLLITTLASRFTSAELRANPDVMKDAALLNWLIDAGVIAATLSSAIASSLGAPRTLQRLAMDKLIPRLDFFGKGAGASDNPRRATALSAGIALVTIAGGDLNVVAPIISMFFLVSYGLINYATFYEARAASTSFRPRFRFFDARLSLLGTLVCAGAVVAIDPLAGLVAAGLLAAIFVGLRRSNRTARWSDSARAHHASEARRHLRAAAIQPADGRDWRPCSLVFVPRDHTHRHRLLTVSRWLEGDVGFTTAVRVVEGSGARVRQQAVMIRSELEREVRAEHPGVFTRVIASSDLSVAASTAVQTHGVGEIRTNLTIHGWTDLEKRLIDGSESQRQALLQPTRLGASVVIAAFDDDDWTRLPTVAPNDRCISVLWGDDHTGSTMTLLAWLVHRHPDWASANLVVHVPDEPGERERVSVLLEEARLDCEVRSVGSDFQATLDALASADLAFAPLRIRNGHPLGPGDSELSDFLVHLNMVFLVRAAEDVELVSDPDEGVIAHLAEARDHAIEAAERAATLDSSAAHLLVGAEMLRLSLEPEAVASNEELAALEADLSIAKRRYADALSRARNAAARVEELEGTADNGLDPTLWTSAPVDDEGALSKPRPQEGLRRKPNARW